MKNIIIAAILTATTLTYADSKRETAAELLEVTGASEMSQLMLTQMFDAIKAGNPNAPTEFFDRFMANVDVDELTEMVIPVYLKHLSEEDMKAAIEFYKTSAGQNLLQKQGIIMQESMIIGQQWGMKIGQQVQEELQKEMQKRNAAEKK